jgi:acetyl-CoA carboxylase biotin carboxyl carrier protein
MNQKELKELIEFLIDKDIAEFELERGDVKVRIKRGAEASSAPGIHFVQAPATPHGPQPISTHPVQPLQAEVVSSAGSAAPESEEDLYIVKSPIVGTFYEAPSPGSPPFFKVGDTVESGQVLCIIEAMKLMNEIESDVSGVITKRFVNNGQPVEYGQSLFAIRQRK